MPNWKLFPPGVGIDGVGLPSVKFVGGENNVQIHAFRGKGDIENLVKAGEDARVGTGHVGISFDGGRTIYGFNPKTPMSHSGEDIIKSLKEGKSYKGQVLDDTSVFSRARELGLNIKVDTVTLNKNNFNKAHTKLMKDVEKSPLDNKRYSFPKRARDAQELGYDFEPNCYNCATYPKSIGIESPYKTGRLGEYLER